MKIIINGKQAALKQGTSFDFVSENRDFSGADSYSMAITFPLKDCPQNLAIFGHINRKDVAGQHLLFDCEIRDRIFYKRGSITITQINEVEVKTQFLEGRSASNYATNFDDAYINQLDLGYPTTNVASYPISNNFNPLGSGRGWVSFPWVNNSSGNVQNDMNLSMSGATWKATQLSFQPYMIYIVKKICDVLGYTYNFSKWEYSNYKYLLVCNTLPAAWNIHNFAKALPHWTFTELLEQLELLMNCEFDIDHARKHITFGFTKEAILNCGTTKLGRVLDDYQVEIVEPGDCKYRACCNLQYAECNHRMWKYYVNPNFIKFWTQTLVSSNLYREVATVWEATEIGRNNGWKIRYDSEVFQGAISRLWYCTEDDRYVIARVTDYVEDGRDEEDGVITSAWGHYYVVPQLVNTFAPRIINPDAETKELKIVPAWLDDTTPNTGQVIFLELPDLRNEKAHKPYNGYQDWAEAMAHVCPEPDMCIKEELAINPDEDEYLDKIYVGFYSGGQAFDTYPHPSIDIVDFYPDWSCDERGWSLALKSDTFNQYAADIEIDPTRKYTFKFLADDLPNVRSVFIIAGQRYVCEKITATFSERGMSQLLKGVFYKVID